MYVLGGTRLETLKYDEKTNAWSELAPIPALRLDPAACAVGSDVYVIGGHTQFGSFFPTADVYKYSVDDNEWRTVSPMPGPRALHGACVLGGMIYVVGGRDAANIRLSTVLRYDPLSDSWSAVAAMSQIRSQPAVFAFQHCLYASSGHSGTSYLSSLEKFEPALDRWSPVASMSVARTDAKAVVLTMQENVFDAMVRRVVQ